MGKKNDHDNIEEMIITGAEIFGSATGGILGFLFAGPIGAAASGAGGVVVGKTLAKLGAEMKQRLLGKREEVRIGATISYAVTKVQEKLDSGRQLRSDGFFNDETNNRSAADEICEGVILVAQKEYEEKKIKFYGNLLANIAFNDEISGAVASQLIRIADALSYRELCLLKIYYYITTTMQFGLRQSNYRNGGTTNENTPLLYEIIDLDNRNLIVNSKHIVQGVIDIVPSEITVHGLGVLLCTMMELNEIPNEDIAEIINMLQ